MSLPNLDAMTDDELADFRFRMRNAELRLPFGRISHRTACLAGAYARLTLRARRWRLDGEIERATKTEKEASRVYWQLRWQARW